MIKKNNWDWIRILLNECKRYIHFEQKYLQNGYSLIIEFNESIEIHKMVDHKITGAHHGRMLYKMAGAEAGV